ncbi:SRPBCC family protein [Amycolatopsis sp. K13G38]|uniref:SRPBCC family protein n=1 Tax=Amycolatopsis acididurans TaxID=2724524 RepID=A0ABX1JFY6_9PSEU|nr:SRPBCC family protein [Amycolatopsis acididurans]NKQ58523.1 SRPBCC family protein [Amycolatopsis acididurans]
MTDLGELTMDGDRATMTFRRRLPYPIETVWAAITDPGRRKSWFGQTTLEAREGGTIEMLPDDPPAPPEAKRMTGRILIWEPPARRSPSSTELRSPLTAVFEHEWNQRIVDESVVRYELTEDGDGTLLTFTHRGLSARNAKGFIPGTHAFLDRLAAHLAGGPLPAWQERYDEVAPAYPSWS